MLQTADSHTTISCLIRSADLAKAVKALHSRFGLAVGADEARSSDDARQPVGLIA